MVEFPPISRYIYSSFPAVPDLPVQSRRVAPIFNDHDRITSGWNIESGYTRGGACDIDYRERRSRRE